MAKMRKYMVVHRNPGIDCNEVQSNWRRLAKVETATWIRTYYNEEMGMRYCLWQAADEVELKEIFSEMDVSFESIIPVEETTPDLWGKGWMDHLEADAAADNLGN